MWDIYFKKANLVESLPVINLWKSAINTSMSNSLVKHFASRVSLYFDNSMLFQSKQNHHDLLLDSLAKAENDFLNINSLFVDVYFYIMDDDNKTFISVMNLPYEQVYLPDKIFEIEIFDRNISYNHSKMDLIKFNSWSTLVFSSNLVDFSSSWIDFVPSLEERALIQTKNIISSTNFKKYNLSLLEKIKFEDNIECYPQFNELYDKLLKVMPKMNAQLHEEFTLNITNKDMNTKSKIKIK